MAADMHIHVLKEPFTEADLASFMSNVLGSKYFNPRPGANLDLFSKCSDTPNVWVGEVSWLKANLADDADTFIPGPVQKVHDLIGEDLPVIDDALIAKVREAFNDENKTTYNVAPPAKVLEFLEQHKGEKVFTVSW
jgi:hypothetical protein